MCGDYVARLQAEEDVTDVTKRDQAADSVKGADTDGEAELLINDDEDEEILEQVLALKAHKLHEEERELEHA